MKLRGFMMMRHRPKESADEAELIRDLFFPLPLLKELDAHPFLLKKISVKRMIEEPRPLIPKMTLKRLPRWTLNIV